MIKPFHLFIFFCFFSFPSFCSRVVWLPSSGGSLLSPANWDSGQIPGPEDEIIIALQGRKQQRASGNETSCASSSLHFLTLDGPWTIRSLTVTGPASLVINAPLHVAETATVDSSSRIRVFSTSFHAGLLDIVGDGEFFLEEGKMENSKVRVKNQESQMIIASGSGSSTIEDSTIIVDSGTFSWFSSGPLVLKNSEIFIGPSGYGKFEGEILTEESSISSNNGGKGNRLVNQGNLLFSSNNHQEIGIPVENSGKISVQTIPKLANTKAAAYWAESSDSRRKPAINSQRKDFLRYFEIADSEASDEFSQLTGETLENRQFPSAGHYSSLIFHSPLVSDGGEIHIYPWKSFHISSSSSSFPSSALQGKIFLYEKAQILFENGEIHIGGIIENGKITQDYHEYSTVYTGNSTKMAEKFFSGGLIFLSRVNFLPNSAVRGVRSLLQQGNVCFSMNSLVKFSQTLNFGGNWRNCEEKSVSQDFPSLPVVSIEEFFSIPWRNGNSTEFYWSTTTFSSLSLAIHSRAWFFPHSEYLFDSQARLNFAGSEENPSEEENFSSPRVMEFRVFPGTRWLSGGDGSGEIRFSSSARGIFLFPLAKDFPSSDRNSNEIQYSIPFHSEGGEISIEYPEKFLHEAASEQQAITRLSSPARVIFHESSTFHRISMNFPLIPMVFQGNFPQSTVFSFLGPIALARNDSAENSLGLSEFPPMMEFLTGRVIFDSTGKEEKIENSPSVRFSTVKIHDATVDFRIPLWSEILLVGSNFSQPSLKGPGPLSIGRDLRWLSGEIAVENLIIEKEWNSFDSSQAGDSQFSEDSEEFPTGHSAAFLNNKRLQVKNLTLMENSRAFFRTAILAAKANDSSSSQAMRWYLQTNATVQMAPGVALPYEGVGNAFFSIPGHRENDGDTATTGSSGGFSDHSDSSYRGETFSVAFWLILTLLIVMAASLAVISFFYLLLKKEKNQEKSTAGLSSADPGQPTEPIEPVVIENFPPVDD